MNKHTRVVATDEQRRSYRVIGNTRSIITGRKVNLHPDIVLVLEERATDGWEEVREL